MFSMVFSSWGPPSSLDTNVIYIFSGARFMQRLLQGPFLFAWSFFLFSFLGVWFGRMGKDDRQQQSTRTGGYLSFFLDNFFLGQFYGRPFDIIGRYSVLLQTEWRKASISRAQLEDTILVIDFFFFSSFFFRAAWSRLPVFCSSFVLLFLHEYNWFTSIHGSISLKRLFILIC